MKLLKRGLAFALLVTAMSSCAVKKFVPFDAALHQEAVMALATESKDTFFSCISSISVAPWSTVEQMELEAFRSNLNSPDYVTLLLYVDENPVGCVQYVLSQNSCESIRRKMEQAGVPSELINAFVDSMRAKNFPEKDADVPLEGVIDVVAVAKEYQRKGYEKILLQYAVEQLVTEKKVDVVTLSVSKDNEVARKLYDSEGFVANESGSGRSSNTVSYKKVVDSAIA